MRDIVEAKKKCRSFIAEMTDNRPNCDDGGMARRILDDLETRGEPSAEHRRRLTHWCHTTGTLYQRGVGIAQGICIAIYGRVLPRED
jgi:hypothetical protein